jgi:hypothetical protein
MDLIVPFLLDCQFLMRAYAVLTACVVTYILKLPPTKNWRPMIAVLGKIKLGMKSVVGNGVYGRKCECCESAMRWLRGATMFGL